MVWWLGHVWALDTAPPSWRPRAAAPVPLGELPSRSARASVLPPAGAPWAPPAAQLTHSSTSRAWHTTGPHRCQRHEWRCPPREVQGHPSLGIWHLSGDKGDLTVTEPQEDPKGRQEEMTFEGGGRHPCELSCRCHLLQEAFPYAHSPRVASFWARREKVKGAGAGAGRG